MKNKNIFFLLFFAFLISIIPISYADRFYISDYIPSLFINEQQIRETFLDDQTFGENSNYWVTYYYSCSAIPNAPIQYIINNTVIHAVGWVHNDSQCDTPYKVLEYDEPEQYVGHTIENTNKNITGNVMTKFNFWFNNSQNISYSDDNNGKLDIELGCKFTNAGERTFTSFLQMKIGLTNGLNNGGKVYPSENISLRTSVSYAGQLGLHPCNITLFNGTNKLHEVIINTNFENQLYNIIIDGVNYCENSYLGNKPYIFNNPNQNLPSCYSTIILGFSYSKRERDEFFITNFRVGNTTLNTPYEIDTTYYEDNPLVNPTPPNQIPDIYPQIAPWFEKIGFRTPASKYLLGLIIIIVTAIAVGFGVLSISKNPMIALYVVIPVVFFESILLVFLGLLPFWLIILYVFMAIGIGILMFKSATAEK